MKPSPNTLLAIVALFVLPWSLIVALGVSTDTGPIPVDPKPATAAEDTLERVILEPGLPMPTRRAEAPAPASIAQRQARRGPPAA